MDEIYQLLTLGWTKAELARRLGVHRATVRKWAAGITYPKSRHTRTRIRNLCTCTKQRCGLVALNLDLRRRRRNWFREMRAACAGRGVLYSSGSFATDEMHERFPIYAEALADIYRIMRHHLR